MESKASAVWKGGLKDGSGTISNESGVLTDTAYTFAGRFEDGGGTNPEELIASAHAGCFSMALSMILEDYDLVADSIETKATVFLEQKDGGFHVPKIHLDVECVIPNATQEQFEEATKTAKENCPISKLMTAEITMDAKLS